MRHCQGALRQHVVQSTQCDGYTALVQVGDVRAQHAVQHAAVRHASHQIVATADDAVRDGWSTWHLYANRVRNPKAQFGEHGGVVRVEVCHQISRCRVYGALLCAYERAVGALDHAPWAPHAVQQVIRAASGVRTTGFAARQYAARTRSHVIHPRGITVRQHVAAGELARQERRAAQHLASQCALARGAGVAYRTAVRPAAVARPADDVVLLAFVQVVVHHEGSAVGTRVLSATARRVIRIGRRLGERGLRARRTLVLRTGLVRRRGRQDQKHALVGLRGARALTGALAVAIGGSGGCDGSSRGDGHGGGDGRGEGSSWVRRHRGVGGVHLGSQ